MYNLVDVSYDLENLQMQYLNTYSNKDERELHKIEQEILFMNCNLCW